MAQAQAFQDALNNHDRVRKSTDLPLFYGRKDKDCVAPNDLVERLENAANIAGWNTDERKCTEFYMILRDRALVWWASLLEDADINRAVWNDVKKEFLKSYAPRFTARTTCTNFQELIQKQGEVVHDYYLRVTEAFKRMSEAQPEAIRTVRADHGAATAAQAAAVKLEGIKDTERFFKHQLFIAGLREEIRTKIMEAGKANLRESLELARELEVILNDRHKKASGVANIHEEDDNAEDAPDLTEEEIYAINLIRHQQGKPPFKFFRRNGNKRNGNGKSDDRKCRFCHRTGHMQPECKKRIAAGAPCVDANGKPWAKQPTKVNGVSSDNQRSAAPPPSNSQPPQQSAHGHASTISGTGGFAPQYNDPYQSLNW